MHSEYILMCTKQHRILIALSLLFNIYFSISEYNHQKSTYLRAMNVIPEEVVVPP